jgi:iron complex outermembrane receptor protein
VDRDTRSREKTACLLWMLIALTSPQLRGDDPQRNPSTGQGPAALKSLTLEELSQIDVTSPSKAPEKAFRTPAAIYVITGEDIRRSGATSIPEALRLAPGVEVARIDANKWAIGIRGFGSRLSRSVLVMIDGRTVYTPLFAGTYWEVQDTMLEDIDRIEVIRGPGGTIWGPNAVNGVISIITKRPTETKGTLVSAGGGNVEQGFSSFRYGAGNDKGLAYRMYGKAFTDAPEEHPDSRNFDDWRALQAGFRMEWNPNNNSPDTITLQGDIYKEAAGESVVTTSYTAPYSRIADANAGLSGGNAMGVWQRKLSNGGDFQLQMYYDRTNRYEPNLGERRNTFDIDFVEHLPFGRRQQITWGLGSRFSQADDLEVVSGLTYQPNNRTDQLYTAFLQDEIRLIDDRLTLLAGTKVIRTNFTGFDFEPSVRLAWTPSDRETVWTAFTHAIRTPSDSEENFYLSGLVGITPSGLPELARFNANPNFSPEQMNGYELGYRRLLGTKVLIDAAGFYNHYHDLFDEEITGTPFLEDNPAPLHYLLPAQFRNGLLGYTKGIEVAPEWRVSDHWRLRGSYSYLHMSLEKSPNSGDVGTAPGIIGSSPQHEVWVQSSFDLWKGFQLDLTYRYESALPGQLVPAYSTGDARFGWRVRRQWELSLVGQNLLQPFHPEFGGDPGPLVGIRRSTYLKLTWSK